LSLPSFNRRFAPALALACALAPASQALAQATEPPPGYSGMERDTTGAEHQPTAVDTFLNEQGTGVPTDTAGYSGIEHQDTSTAAAGDTSGMTGADTTTSSLDTTGQQ